MGKSRTVKSGKSQAQRAQMSHDCTAHVESKMVSLAAASRTPSSQGQDRAGDG